MMASKELLWFFRNCDHYELIVDSLSSFFPHSRRTWGRSQENLSINHSHIASPFKIPCTMKNGWSPEEDQSLHTQLDSRLGLLKHSKGPLLEPYAFQCFISATQLARSSYKAAIERHIPGDGSAASTASSTACT